MARPRSPELLQALALVSSGKSHYAAAKIAGLRASSISRAIKPPIKHKCPTCGKTMRNKKPAEAG